MKRRILTLGIITLLLVSMTGCTNTLGKVADASKKFAQVIGEVQKNTYAFYDAKIIDAKTKDAIIDACTRANLAGLQVDAVLLEIKKADAAAKEIGLSDRERIVKILVPVSEALDPQKLEAIAGIKNEDAKRKLEGGLIAARSVISSIQIIIASGG